MSYSDNIVNQNCYIKWQHLHTSKSPRANGNNRWITWINSSLLVRNGNQQTVNVAMTTRLRQNSRHILTNTPRQNYTQQSTTLLVSATTSKCYIIIIYPTTIYVSSSKSDQAYTVLTINSCNFGNDCFWKKSTKNNNYERNVTRVTVT